MYIKELDSFLTVKLLEDTPAVLSLGKLWGLELERAGLACSSRRHPQVIGETQSPHLEEYFSYWDRTRCFLCHGCARSNLRLPHSSAEAATMSLDAGVANGRFVSA